jgi:hypothetical protein
VICAFSRTLRNRLGRIHGNGYLAVGIRRLAAALVVGDIGAVHSAGAGTGTAEREQRGSSWTAAGTMFLQLYRAGLNN